MERAVSTRPSQRVDDPAAVTLLLDPDRLRFLHPFMLGERSTADAAAEVGVSVKDMAYRVKRMLELGLIACSREQKRAGRPVRFYRAAAVYFVPFAAVPEGDLEEMVHDLLRAPQRQLVAGLVRTLADTEDDLHRWGWQILVDGEERLSIRPASAPDDERPLFRRLLDDRGPALFLANITLRLRHQEAKSLQRELLDLLERYDGRDGPDAYVLTIGLTPARDP